MLKEREKNIIIKNRKLKREREIKAAGIKNRSHH
jgi:hypothetical protein